MAISETYAFNPDIGDIVEEAFERAGLELRSGHDLRTARRSLNFLTLEWQNRGINLWTIEEKFITAAADGTSLGETNYLLKDVASYRLDLGTISLLDMVLRTNDGNVNTQTDFQLNRISEPTFATIPNKLSSSRPLQFNLERKEILGSGALGVDQYYTVTVGGLAYHIACKRPEAESRIQMLKQQYEELFIQAAEEDRVKASVRFVPFIPVY